jgi:predicted nuclease of predicted toxin-antitoxin system
LDRTDDQQTFLQARLADVTILTKDGDFVNLLERLGPPPKIVLVACGNCTNRALRELLSSELPDALTRLTGSESSITIG